MSKEKTKILMDQGSLETFSELVRTLEEQHAGFTASITRLSETFKTNVLDKLEYDESWETKVDRPVFYRVCNPIDGVFSTTGSLMDGGRCNIGGAQKGEIATQKYGDLARPQGTIYLSDNADTAIIESIGEEYGDNEKLRDKVRRSKNKSLYKVWLVDESKPILLIELEAIIQLLSSTYLG